MPGLPGRLTAALATLFLTYDSANFASLPMKQTSGRSPQTRLSLGHFESFRKIGDADIRLRLRHEG